MSAGSVRTVFQGQQLQPSDSWPYMRTPGLINNRPEPMTNPMRVPSPQPTDEATYSQQMSGQHASGQQMPSLSYVGARNPERPPEKSVALSNDTTKLLLFTGVAAATLVAIDLIVRFAVCKKK